MSPSPISVRAKGNEKKEYLSQTSYSAVSRRSGWISWRDSPPEQTGRDGEDAVMEDCTESHQSEINGKIKAKGKLRNVLTYMPDERRALIYGDSSQSKMQSLDEKTALLAVKSQLLPLPCQLE